jgi:hypothetical protein
MPRHSTPQDAAACAPRLIEPPIVVPRERQPKLTQS